MPFVFPPANLVVGQPTAACGTAQVVPGASAAVVFNNSSNLVQVTSAGGTALLQPLQADVYPAGKAQTIPMVQVVSSRLPSGCYCGTVQMQSYTATDQQQPGSFPLPLSAFPGGASLVAVLPAGQAATVSPADASASGSTLTIASSVASVPSPLSPAFNQAALLPAGENLIVGPVGIAAGDGACTGSAFTVELSFMLAAALTSDSALISRWVTGGLEWAIVLSTSGMEYWWNDTSLGLGSTSVFFPGVAYRVAMCWTGTDMYAFVNGATDLGPVAVSTKATPSNQAMVIGGEPDIGPWPNPVMTVEEVRVSDVARYTGPYSLPSVPFVADASTVMLYHLDAIPTSSYVVAPPPGTGTLTIAPAAPGETYFLVGNQSGVNYGQPTVQANGYLFWNFALVSSLPASLDETFTLSRISASPGGDNLYAAPGLGTPTQPNQVALAAIENSVVTAIPAPPSGGIYLFGADSYVSSGTFAQGEILAGSGSSLTTLGYIGSLEDTSDHIDFGGLRTPGPVTVAAIAGDGYVVIRYALGP